MNEDRIYPSMVIRSQAEAIELLEQENQQLKHNWNELKEWLKDTAYWGIEMEGCFNTREVLNKMHELEKESDVK